MSDIGSHTMSSSPDVPDPRSGTEPAHDLDDETVDELRDLGWAFDSLRAPRPRPISPSYILHVDDDAVGIVVNLDAYR